MISPPQRTTLRLPSDRGFPRPPHLPPAGDSLIGARPYSCKHAPPRTLPDGSLSIARAKAPAQHALRPFESPGCARKISLTERREPRVHTCVPTLPRGHACAPMLLLGNATVLNLRLSVTYVTTLPFSSLRYALASPQLWLSDRASSKLCVCVHASSRPFKRVRISSPCRLSRRLYRPTFISTAVTSHNSLPPPPQHRLIHHTRAELRPPPPPQTTSVIITLTNTTINALIKMQSQLKNTAITVPPNYCY